MSGLTNITTSLPPYNTQTPGFSYTDLSYIFQPYTAGDTGPATNILVNGIDLNAIFQPYTGGATASATNIKANVGGTPTDLSQIFAPLIN